MATTSTGLVLATHFFQHYAGAGDYLANAQIGALAAGSVTSVFKFRGTSILGTDHYRNKGAMPWRPENATGIADDVRYAGDLTASSGALAVDTNWADTTLGSESLWLPFGRTHPQCLIDAFNMALRDIYFENEDALSYAADAGFQSTATSDWGTSNATIIKKSTDGSQDIFPTYIRSGEVAITSDEGYIAQTLTTIRGAEWLTGVLIRVDLGTFKIIWRDLDNSAEIGTSPMSTEESWIYMERLESVTGGASGTERLSVRLQGDTGSEQLFIQALWAYPTDSRLITLNSTWDTRFKMPTLYYLTFDKQLSTGVWDAKTMRKNIIPNPDQSTYEFLISRAGANPYAVRFHDNSYLRYPIMIEGRRAHSDVDGPFTRAMTETTSADRDLFVAAAGRRYFADDRCGIPEKAALLAQAEREFAFYSQQGTVQRKASRGYRWQEVSA